MVVDPRNVEQMSILVELGCCESRISSSSSHVGSPKISRVPMVGESPHVVRRGGSAPKEDAVAMPPANRPSEATSEAGRPWGK